VKLQGNTPRSRLRRVGPSEESGVKCSEGWKYAFSTQTRIRNARFIVRGLLPWKKGAELHDPGPRVLLASHRNTRQAHIKTLLRRPLHDGLAVVLLRVIPVTSLSRLRVCPPG